VHESKLIPTPNTPHIHLSSSDYKDDGTNILLDANENAYGPGLDLDTQGALNGDNKTIDLLGLNRYPDPHQEDLKLALCALRNGKVHTTRTISPEHLFVGVGSDEAIDALLRCFCAPGRDKVLTCPPTYGMYKVSAQVNDVEVVHVPLKEGDFSLDVVAIQETLRRDERIKLTYFCSPGNPTGTVLRKEDVKAILETAGWNGVVVVDEAYIDFAPVDSSLAEYVAEWPNLVVMQTLSKAFGLAGIRLGAAFTDPAIARLLNSMKAPYNISNPTSELARAALEERNLNVMRTKVNAILKQRDRMVIELPKIKGVGRLRGGLDANFLLVEMLNASGKPCNEVALAVYERLAGERGVVVRFRGKEKWCTGCLRITVGTEVEVARFLEELESILGEILGSKIKVSADEEKKEIEANNVVA
jgi:histidinol-phosphate aminotransferase